MGVDTNHRHGRPRPDPGTRPPPTGCESPRFPPLSRSGSSGSGVAGGVLTNDFRGYLGHAFTTDRVANETVVTGPAALDGSFRSLAHETSGTARVIERPDGTRVLTLAGFLNAPGSGG